MSEYPEVLKLLYLILNEDDEIIDDEDYKQWCQKVEFNPIKKEEGIKKIENFLKEGNDNGNSN